MGAELQTRRRSWPWLKEQLERRGMDLDRFTSQDDISVVMHEIAHYLHLWGMKEFVLSLPNMDMSDMSREISNSLDFEDGYREEVKVTALACEVSRRIGGVHCETLRQRVINNLDWSERRMNREVRAYLASLEHKREIKQLATCFVEWLEGAPVDDDLQD